MLKVIKNQKYQTCAEVKQAAKEGREAAIRSSIRHWNELATAPVSDLISRGLPGFTISECALCIRHSGYCNVCPLFIELNNTECYGSGEVYSKASSTIKRVREYDHPKAVRDKLIKRFRRAAEKMIKRLENCLEDYCGRTEHE